MDFLNSQLLTQLDGFYHKFQVSGDYKWGVGAVGTYTVHVTPAGEGQKPNFWTINLTYDSNSGTYTPDQQNLNIVQQDWVLWHAPGAGFNAPPYSVLGNGPAAFNSRSLAVGDMFSHQFVQTAPYPYVISGGSGGAQNGTVQVDKPAKPPAKPTATNVNVFDAKPPQPDPANIVSGDTILWVINSGVGFVIRNA